MFGGNNNEFEVNLFSGPYHCKVTKFNKCVSNSDTANVVFHNKPAPPVLTVNGFKLSTTGFILYEWYVNGNIISGSMNSTHIATVNGYYYVVGIDNNGCSVTSNSVDVVGVGLPDHNNVSENYTLSTQDTILKNKLNKTNFPIKK